MLLRLYNDDSPLIDHSQRLREKNAEAKSREDAMVVEGASPTAAMTDPPLSNAEMETLAEANACQPFAISL